jgi:hypothetical protein
MLVVVPPVAIGLTTPAGNQLVYVPSYHSTILKSVLNLTSPFDGLAGRCAVEPLGSCRNPVLLIVVFCSVAMLSPLFLFSNPLALWTIYKFTPYFYGHKTFAFFTKF